jgi:ATP-dependent RNA helicase DDX52/ROK1
VCPSSASIKDPILNEELDPELDFFNDRKDTEVKKQVADVSLPPVETEEKCKSMHLLLADLGTVDLSNDDQVGRFRKQHKIKVYGTDVPYPISSFSQLFEK